jgi:hypothetical protein
MPLMLEVKGVAVGGTGHDPKAMAQHGNGGATFGLTVGAIFGLMREYPELLPLGAPDFAFDPRPEHDGEDVCRTS